MSRCETCGERVKGDPFDHHHGPTEDDAPLLDEQLEPVARAADATEEATS